MPEAFDPQLGQKDQRNPVRAAYAAARTVGNSTQIVAAPYRAGMSFDGEYGPSTWDWVAEQVTEYEASGGTRANTLRDTGIPIIVMTTVGHKSGLVRKVPLMRVEHEGTYALIASKGGAPAHPGWFHNLTADPTVLVQDGPEPWTAQARQISGDERAEWYQRGIDVFPPYAEYQAKTDREIPVFLASNPST